MTQTAKHIIFAGRVQGVGFRFTASSIAKRYQLTGFVRNLPDGTVEMLAQGDDQDVENCIQDIKESLTGYVRDVRIDPLPLNTRYTDFRITF
jgi:acylphosphatase